MQRTSMKKLAREQSLPRELQQRPPEKLPELQRRRLQRTPRKPRRLRKQLLLQRLNTTGKLELRLKN